MSGVSDDGADFDVAGDGEALSGHRNEVLVDADAVIGAHFVRTRAEETREGDIGKHDHVGCVGVSHALDWWVGALGRRLRWRRGEQHLKAVEGWTDLE